MYLVVGLEKHLRARIRGDVVYVVLHKLGLLLKELVGSLDHLLVSVRHFEYCSALISTKAQEIIRALLTQILISVWSASNHIIRKLLAA